MSDKLFFTQAQVEAVADAIRGKTGESGLLKIGDMPEKIKGIGAGIDSNALLSQILAGENPIIEDFTYTGDDYIFHYLQGGAGGVFMDDGLADLLRFFKVKKATFTALEEINLNGGVSSGGQPALEELSAPSAKSGSAYSYSALKKISFPSLETLADYGFSENPLLKKIELPSIKHFNLGTAYPFDSMTGAPTNLARVDLGENLESLNYRTDSTSTKIGFIGPSLKELILRTTAKVLEPASYLPESFTTEGGEGYVYVPGDLLESYKEQWANLTTHFKTLEEIPEWTED